MVGRTLKTSLFALLCLGLLFAGGCVNKPRLGWGLPWFKSAPAKNRARERTKQIAGESATSNRLFLEPARGELREVVAKSYELGKKASAVNGQPMFSVRNYTASTVRVAAVANRDFRQPCRRPTRKPRAAASAVGEGTEKGIFLCRSADGSMHFQSTRCAPVVDETLDPATAPVGAAADEALACRSGRLKYLGGASGQRFTVAGTVVDGDAAYYALELPIEGGSLYLLVDGGGGLRDERYVLWRSSRGPRMQPKGAPLEVLNPGLAMDAPGPLFAFETAETMVAQVSHAIRYDLVFKGLTKEDGGENFHILYREYRRDDPSRPLHMRDLSYGTGEKQIELAGVQVRVDEVDEDRISFTVLAD